MLLTINMGETVSVGPIEDGYRKVQVVTESTGIPRFAIWTRNEHVEFRMRS